MNTRVGCHFLLQGIFPTQGSNLCLLHWQADSLPLSHQGSPKRCCVLIVSDPLWTHGLCNLLSSSVHSIFWTRILEWVAVSSSGLFLTQGLNLHLLSLLHWQAGFLSLVPPGKRQEQFWGNVVKWINQGQLMPLCFCIYVHRLHGFWQAESQRLWKAALTYFLHKRYFQMLNQNIYKGSLCTCVTYFHWKLQDDILSNSQFLLKFCR